MASLTPQPPYSREELEKLYPCDLELKLVQVFLRHGERTPVNARFQNAGLPTYWAYCNVARRMAAAAVSREDLKEWGHFEWRRVMEGFGDNDQAVLAKGPKHEVEGICQPGELTDKGRQTTFALGQRLRHLYVDQLGFLPAIRANTDDLYLRTTPIPRALESLQETFLGMYPASARTANFTPPTIVARALSEETLYPNEAGCRRFRQLARLFAQRAADKWNDSEEMAYLNKLYGKWMPENSPVAVDGHPRLSGIMDTINATRSHGPETRLPKPFYDERGIEYVDKIAVDEWYSGYKEDREFRTLGIGGLLGDVVDRMVSTAVKGSWRPESELKSAGETGPPVKFALSGCHDTTLAAMLISTGASNGEEWPPFTSSVAVELFHKPNSPSLEPVSSSGSLLSRFLPFGSKSATTQTARAAGTYLPPAPLDNHYVRLRYNDRIMSVPGCAAPGNHLPGDPSMCTLAAFKGIVDRFTPQDWRSECRENMDKGIFARGREPAGFP